eukprot:scaffold55661_cov19-Tisochrysis_lutea.AAC.1
MQPRPPRHSTSSRALSALLANSMPGKNGYDDGGKGDTVPSFEWLFFGNGCLQQKTDSGACVHACAC